MKFTLIYDGDLPAGDNKRAVYASKIRNPFTTNWPTFGTATLSSVNLPTRRAHSSTAHHGATANMRLRPFRTSRVRSQAPTARPSRFSGPYTRSHVGSFIPAIRDSLYLACAIDILFLRHEEPMKLFREGGDLDNRLKCFFDGLRMPNEEEGHNGEALTADPLYCLLEDDRLISDFSVRTGRLLGKGEKARFAVRIQAEVTVKVLRVMDQNQCLIGG